MIPPHIDRDRAARLASLSGCEKAILGTFLGDLAGSGASAPPPSGETAWQRVGKTLWWRWYYGHLCVAQKTATRRYVSRVNGATTGLIFLELWEAQGSAEVAAKSFAMDYSYGDLERGLRPVQNQSTDDTGYLCPNARPNFRRSGSS